MFLPTRLTDTDVFTPEGKVIGLHTAPSLILSYRLALPSCKKLRFPPSELFWVGTYGELACFLLAGQLFLLFFTCLAGEKIGLYAHG